MFVRAIWRAFMALVTGVFLAFPAQAGEVTVFAAASLKTALDEVAAGFTADTGHRATIAYAGSSALARQIQQGAPADVFISANPGWMDVLEADGLIDAASRFDLLSNALVLIAHGASAPAMPLLELPDLLADDYLAMALVNAVPAGIYGKAALQHLGLWTQIAPQVAQADNVRAALMLVAIGEAPFGIVYATDAHAEPRVSIVATFPPETHPKITYPAAAVTNGNRQNTGFLAYLQSDAARLVFEAQGFKMAAQP